MPCARRKQVEYVRKYRLKIQKPKAEKACAVCGAKFTPVNGRYLHCPNCVGDYQRNYAMRNRAKIAQQQRAYRARQGDQYREKMSRRYHQRIAEMTPEELAEFRKREAVKTKRLVAALKDAAFRAYGGWRCACCGESERTFLTIDHIDGGGRKMREIHGQTGDFYRWLKKRGYPPGFQILCMNCNFGKHQNGGVCPHQGRRND